MQRSFDSVSSKAVELLGLTFVKERDSVKVYWTEKQQDTYYYLSLSNIIHQTS